METDEHRTLRLAREWLASYGRNKSQMEDCARCRGASDGGRLMCDREMTLAKWVARLPANHQGHQELERLQAQVNEQQAWIDTAVASCAKRGCQTLEHRLRESEDRIAELESERDRLRDAIRTWAESSMGNAASWREHGPNARLLGIASEEES